MSIRLQSPPAHVEQQRKLLEPELPSNCFEILRKRIILLDTYEINQSCYERYLPFQICMTQT